MTRQNSSYVKDAIDGFVSSHKNNTIRIGSLLRLAPYMKPFRGKVILAALLVIGGSVLVLPAPYLMKYIIDVTLPAKDFSQLALIIALIFLLGLANLIVNSFVNYIFSTLNQELLLRIKASLLQKLLKLPTAFYDKQQSGYLMSRVEEVQALDALFSSEVVKTITGLLQFVFCLCVMFYINAKLTLISLLAIPLFFWITRFAAGSVQKLSMDYYEESALVSKDIQESFSGVTTVKVFAAENRQAEKIDKGLRRLLKTSVVRNIVVSFLNDAIYWVAGLVTLLIFWLSIHEIILGIFTLGGYIAISGYLSRLFQPVSLLAAINITLQPSIVALNRISELLDLTSEEESTKRTRTIEKISGDILFDNVSFAYEEQKGVIHNLSLHIPSGKCTAITGPSGSGKTTVVRLLLGLYEPSDGRILIDGCDINSLILSNLREQIGIVSQNVFLFNDTVRNNICFSKPRASEEDIIKAAQIADAHEFILAMPNGYDTIVGERGVMLSGGQMQRISMARTILKDPAVIILDEATSHIDAESETRVLSMVNKLFIDKTRIIITHRLGPISDLVDQIIRLKPHEAN